MDIKRAKTASDVATKAAEIALELCKKATTREDFEARRAAYLRAEAHAAKLWTVYMTEAESAAWRDAVRKG